MRFIAHCLLLCTAIAFLFTPVIASADDSDGIYSEPELILGDTRGLTSLFRMPDIAGAGYNVFGDNKYVALTFDDGPHKLYTAQILDILAEYGVKATFFIVGKNCEKYPELVKREIDDGHEVGNHTYSHPDIGTLDESGLVHEVLAAEETLQGLREYKPKLFRPPAGKYNAAIDRIIAKLNYTAVLWNVDTQDWKAPATEKITARVFKNVKPGNIILMHDYVVGKSHTPESLRVILPQLIEQGYRFVTMSELIRASGNGQE